ncbi:MAG: alpha-L-rhamnosidase, partial [Planctomycetes bacterium]|nr:alpha-L-rhamnosidase [Planctomycetota bacterium]
LQMCSHETYFDCPYYEQLMYVGDTRLEVLATYCTTHDDRLPRKALRMFDESRLPLGLTQSRYPSRVTQVIPPFSLWWVGMVSDFGRWRDDPAGLRRLMPGVRAVLDAFHGCLNADGLVQAPPGWNYLDWVPTWRWGIPADADRGVNAGINWQYVLALLMAAELEATVGEHELAARDNRLADALARRLAAAFWDAKRGLLADDLAKQHFSEHVQCLALLSGRLDERKAARVARGLFEAPDLARTTIYFTHYLFETCCLLGRMDVLFQRLGLWLDLPDLGFKTTFEHPEPSRSDCHAWAAHPIFHYFATILGIRPASPGFATVSIRPQLGPLTEARGKLVHPRGSIEVALKADGPRVGGRIVLPEGVSGTFVSGKKRVKLHAGAQNV